MPNEHFLATALKAADAGAREIMRYRKSFKVSVKGRNDLVTNADVASQQAIQQIISSTFPDHLFVGEELGASHEAELAKIADGYVWIVDPLDGTANYVHGLQGYAVSIALCQQGIPLVGVVLDPVSGERFHAVRGCGAFLGEQKLTHSGCGSIADAMIACSFPPAVKRNSPDVIRFGFVLEKAQSMRRLGSAALNLCYVASGRLDAYWATCVNAWDIAAGFLIVNEAGGSIRNLDGGDADLWNPKFIAAASESLNYQIAETIRAADEGIG